MALKMVPNSNKITEGLCKYFSGYLMLDAKYVAVRGHERKIAFIWAVDYYKHDILFSGLYPEETYASYWNLLKFIKRIGYNMKAIISDEHPAILRAGEDLFPKARKQICHTHVLRNIQKALNLKGSNPDRAFFSDIKTLFASKLVPQYSRRATNLVKKYAHDPKYLSILADLDRKHEQLITYLIDHSCPRTTNLIEGYNSHLAQRLKAIKGFKSYETANLWLNGFVVLKRITDFTDCGRRFKKLNGQCPLFQTVEDYGPVRKIQKYFGIPFSG